MRRLVSEANIDAMDVAGDQQNGIDHDIFKTRLSANGEIIGDAFRHDLDGDEDPDPLPEDYCGSCYGASEIEGVRTRPRSSDTCRAGAPL